MDREKQKELSREVKAGMDHSWLSRRTRWRLRFFRSAEFWVSVFLFPFAAMWLVSALQPKGDAAYLALFLGKH